MNLIETKPVGETHLSHFAVDFGDADIRLNGKQYPTGKVTHDNFRINWRTGGR